MIEEANIEQITKNEVEQTTGINPEVISPSNESSISPITKIDPISFNLGGDNNQERKVSSPTDEGEADKDGKNTSGRKWCETIKMKQEGSIEIPL